MKRTVWTYGLIGGAIVSLMMVLSMQFHDRIGFDRSEILGYTTMLAAFLMVYFGIRSYRDSVLGGAITFGRAFRTGLLIVLITSTMYVATWQVLSRTTQADYMEKYSAYVLDKARAEGKPEAEIAEQQRQMAQFAEQYKNPVVNVAFTYLEIVPVGLVVTLLSAGVLSRRRPVAAGTAVA